MTEDQSQAASADGADRSAPTGIVVGVDGSEHSKCALRWAVAEARTRDAALNLVTAYSVPVFAASGLDGGFATINDDEISQGAQAVVQQAARHANDAGVDCTAQVANGDASAVLIDASETASMIVIGSRGRGGFLGRLLGTVSSGLPGHAKCPTVVVPKSCADRLVDEPNENQQIEPVVCVGVDGSNRARFATLVAAEYAHRHNLSLRVLCAVPSYSQPVGWLPSPVDREALLDQIREQLQAGERWLKHHYPDVQVQIVVAEGNPIERLIDATEDCELVVAGSRGHGGFAGMLLGSTTDGLLHHAKGPVMVVVDQDDPRLNDREDFGPALAEI